MIFFCLSVFFDFYFLIFDLMDKGALVFILGVSGSGKTTVIAELLRLYPEEIVFVPSYTTRQPRPGEVPGQRYHFITREAFQAGIAAGEFLERAVVHQIDYYGTRKLDVVNYLDQGKLVIKESDMHGLQKLALEAETLPYCSIFLWLDDETIRSRIVHRGAPMSPDELEHRLQSAAAERAQAIQTCDLALDAAPGVPVVLEEVVEGMGRVLRERFGIDFPSKISR
jgi:guanylate kinase